MAHLSYRLQLLMLSACSLWWITNTPTKNLLSSLVLVINNFVGLIIEHYDQQRLAYQLSFLGKGSDYIILSVHCIVGILNCKLACVANPSHQDPTSLELYLPLRSLLVLWQAKCHTFFGANSGVRDHYRS